MTRVFELEREGFLLSTAPDKLDLAAIHDYLCNQSYWAKGRSEVLVRATIEGSLCFGLYKQSTLIGFARVVTDYATVAYLSDLFIVDSYQGQGLGKWLIEGILEHPQLKTLKRFMLLTGDAQNLYAKYGFKTLGKNRPYDYMERIINKA